MKKAFVVGGASLDYIIHLDKFPSEKSATIFSEDAYKTIGSTGSGKAISLQKLGVNTVFHAMIGDDASGTAIHKTLNEYGVNFIYDIDPEGTEEHVNLMDKNGGRISIFTRTSSFEPKFEHTRLHPYLQNCDYLVLNIINYARRLIPEAKQQQKEIWCDIHDYDGQNAYHSDFIDAADYLFLSSDKLNGYEKFMDQMIKQKKKLVVCTHGSKGVSAITADGQTYKLEVVSDYKLVDSNGAGDNFFSGFLYAHSKGYPVQTCLEYGTITAGLCIKSKSIVNPILSSEVIELEHNKYYR
jgi:sugar/nucleoside kinase (ribokinase family)